MLKSPVSVRNAGSGLIDNPQNIALRCDCEAGRRMNNMIPMFNDMEVLAAA